MTTSTTIGMMVAAGALGVTHGIEPDHVAGISALTGGTKDSKLAAVVGACFAAGHVALVVGWVLVGWALLGATSFPPILETVGLVVVGCLLVLLSGVLGFDVARKLVHRHDHDHGEGLHSHFHLHLPGRHGDAHHDAPHDHEHTLVEYLKLGVVGAMFTLSPPLSMILFVSVVVADASPGIVVLVVAAYAVSITLTMVLVGYGAGTVFRLTERLGARAHTAMQVVVAGLVLVVALRLLWDNVPALLT